ncbi:MAG: phosphate acyltransferase [Defluviitaleaceae bacterium]|nr:phosphate acyltransferase [Defluviitaleaceae bacterium]
MIKSFEQLLGTMKQIQAPPTIVLAGVDESSINALEEAKSLWGIKYITTNDAKEAVGFIKDNKGNVLMKGSMPTGELLKAVVDKQNGIGVGGLMTHIAAFECPAYHKLLFVTDGGMVTAPDLEQKTKILKNAVDFLLKIGYKQPKVAAICAAEALNPKIEETVHASELAKSASNGDFGDIILEGPISFDLAISQKSAEKKGFESKIAGETDLCLMPNIASGNVLGKSLLYMGNAKMAGCILGASVPIVLTTRGASSEEKILSMALALAVK